MKKDAATLLQCTGARVSALGILAAGALAACGGGSSGGSSMPAASGPNTPLAITQSNANAAAAEAVLTPATLADGATTGTGVGAMSAVVAPAMGALDRRVVQQLVQTQNGHPAGGGSVTLHCAAAGSFTAATSVDGKTLTVTFAGCSQIAGSSIDGTQTYANFTLTAQSASDSVSANVTDALTIVVGGSSYAESGQYAFALAAAKTAGGAFSTVTFGLTGSSLDVTASKSGAVTDTISLTDFEFNFKEDLTVAPHQLYSSFNYGLASSRLGGQIMVTTEKQLKQIVDPAETHLFPYAGQVMIAGSNGMRLQVTILGDETFVPPAGEGQVELELDTGTGVFGPPTWLSWPTLAAAG